MPTPPAGRCEHECKPDQAPGFMDGSYEPSSRVDPKRRVGNGDRTPWPRFDATQAVQLTGQWRNPDGLFHLFINQAGKHIELLLALVENGWTGTPKSGAADRERLNHRVFRLGGDLDDADTYKLYVHRPGIPIDNKDIGCGHLRWKRGGKHLVLELDLAFTPAPNSEVPPNEAHTATLRDKWSALVGQSCDRIGQEPNLFENYLARPWIPPEVRTACWFPFTTQQEAALPRFLLDARISLDSENFLEKGRGARPHKLREFRYAELVEKYFQIRGKYSSLDKLGPIEPGRKVNITTALNELVMIARGDAFTTPATNGGIDSFQEQFWRLASLRALQVHNLALKPGENRSLMTHTQAILDGAPVGGHVDNFGKVLGLYATSGPQAYKGTLDFVGVDGSDQSKDALKKVLARLTKQAGRIVTKLTKYLPLARIAGTLRVEKDSPGAFEGLYGFFAGGVQLSRSLGAGTTVTDSKGTAFAYGQPWRPEHIGGPLTFIDVGGTIFAGPIGEGASATLMNCFGGGAGKPPSALGFNFSGFSDVMGTGVGGSVSARTLAGFAYRISSSGGDVELDLDDDDQVLNYGAHTAAGPLHFPINGAGLHASAAELLEIFAACELAVLSRPGVEIEVHGYADQPDDAFRNLVLSRNRAISVFNFLKNVLGGHLALPELHSVPAEDVERGLRDDAARAGEEYTLHDASTRSTTIVPHGEKPSETQDAGRPKFDERYRRVDVFVNGQLRVTLRRRLDEETEQFE